MEARYEPSEPGEDAEQDLTRRERERLMRRQLMLKAACGVFAEKGYADATLDEIAQRAEFGKGTLYNYFEGGKEEILYAVFDNLYDELYHLIDQTFSPARVDAEPFRSVFETFLAAVFAFFAERQDLFMIMMKEGHRLTFNDEPEKAAYFLQQSERIVTVLVPTIEAATTKGEIREFPPRFVANMVMGNVKGVHMHMCMNRCRNSAGIAGGDGAGHELRTPEESARLLSTFLLDGLLTTRDVQTQTL